MGHCKYAEEKMVLTGIGTKSTVIFPFKAQFMWRNNRTSHLISDRINYFEKYSLHKNGAGYSIAYKSAWSNHDN